MDPNYQAIQEKLNRGETLTAQETKDVMSMPNVDDGAGGAVPLSAEEEKELETGEEISSTSANEEESSASAKSEESSSTTSDESAASGEKKGEEESSASAKSDESSSSAESGKTESSSSAESKKPDNESLVDKLEKELSKPEGQEDLTTYSERERGLFYALRQQRKRAQGAEADRDTEKFKNIKAANLLKEKTAQEDKEKKTSEVETEIKKILEGEDEFISKKDLARLVELIRKPAEKTDTGLNDEDRARERHAFTVRAETNAKSIVDARRKSEPTLPDYNDVLEKCGPVIIEGNEAYENQIAEAVRKGENPALLCYELIIKDPSFVTLYKPGTAAKKEEKTAEEKAKEKKAAEGKENLSKINKNLDKTNTSGTKGGSGGATIKDSKGNEYTLMQLYNMSSSEFRKVPREVREKFLEQT